MQYYFIIIANNKWYVIYLILAVVSIFESDVNGWKRGGVMCVCLALYGGGSVFDFIHFYGKFKWNYCQK